MSPRRPRRPLTSLGPKPDLDDLAEQADQTMAELNDVVQQLTETLRGSNL